MPIGWALVVMSVSLQDEALVFDQTLLSQCTILYHYLRPCSFIREHVLHPSTPPSPLKKARIEM